MTELLVILTIPVVTALVGWGTNWAAVKMIFHPIQFVGVGRIGWQGIVYSHADMFSDNVGRMLSSKLLSPELLTEQLDAEKVADFVDAELAVRGEPILAACAEALSPGLWQSVAPGPRQLLLGQLRAELRKATADMAAQLRTRTAELIDLHGLITGVLRSDDGRLMASFFRDLSAKELKFIEYYGGVFGLLIGLVELATWQVTGVWWLLPVVGAAVGAGTNYLALLMIFRPHERTRYLGIPYQGLFPRRQAEIAGIYGRGIADMVLTPEHLLDRLCEGETGAQMRAFLGEALDEHLARGRDRVAPLSPTPIDDAAIERMKAAAWRELQPQLPELRARFASSLGEQLDVAGLTQSRMRALSKHDLERLVRPVFEEDEWILLAVGAGLGGAVGLLQGAAVLALG